MKTVDTSSLGSFVAGWLTRATHLPTISIVECVLFVVSLIRFLGLKVQVYIPDTDEEVINEINALRPKPEKNQDTILDD